MPDPTIKVELTREEAEALWAHAHEAEGLFGPVPSSGVARDAIDKLRAALDPPPKQRCGRHAPGVTCPDCQPKQRGGVGAGGMASRQGESLSRGGDNPVASADPASPPEQQGEEEWPEAVYRVQVRGLLNPKALHFGDEVGDIERVIRRLVKLYTNPGELVFDPFTGIGSTPYVAVEEGRRALGFELKESYHRQACRNVEKVAAGGSAQMSLEEALAA